MTTDITRRTLARGAAWSVPVIAAAVAVPAASASNVAIPCPVIPWRAEAWVTSIGTPRSNAPTNWLWSAPDDAPVWEVITDANSRTEGQRTTTYTYIPVVAGNTYNFEFLIQTKKGDNELCKTVNSRAEIVIGTTLSPLGPSVVLFEGYTKSGGGVQVMPPNCDSGVRGSVWGHEGVAGRRLTANATYRATVTGKVLFRLSILNDPTVEGDNDDWRITPRFTSCTR